MATSIRPRNAGAGAALERPRRGGLRADPGLPRTLVDLVLTSDPMAAPAPAQRRAAEPPYGRPAAPIPHRLPRPLRAEMPPNILYRRYPLVTSLLVELDELARLTGGTPPRRQR